MSPEQATALRRPFPKESIGKLPKAGVMLDYVGHAAVTDRLLTVDPEWSWRPFTVEESTALPPDLRNAGLWIHLTVCGVERIGVGDGKNAKECIGDAIRNAAMRFGVALDLWAKENLVEFAQAVGGGAASTPLPPSTEVTDVPAPGSRERPESPLLDSRGKLAKAMFAAFRDADINDRGERLEYVGNVVGREVTSSAELTDDEARGVIEALKSYRPPVAPTDGGPG